MSEPEPTEYRLRPLPALSKAKLNRLRRVVKEKLAQGSSAGRVDPSPPPRFDQAFQRGSEWLDSLAGEPIDSEAGVLDLSALARPFIHPPAAG